MAARWATDHLTGFLASLLTACWPRLRAAARAEEILSARSFFAVTGLLVIAAVYLFIRSRFHDLAWARLSPDSAFFTWRDTALERFRLSSAVELYNAGDEAKAAAFKPTWEDFKKTRETEIIPLVYAGKNADAKAIATGIQAERMGKMKAAMGCK